MFPSTKNRNEGTFGHPRYENPERRYIQMSSSTKTRNEGTFTKTTLLRNRPFVSARAFTEKGKRRAPTSQHKHVLQPYPLVPCPSPTLTIREKRPYFWSHSAKSLCFSLSCFSSLALFTDFGECHLTCHQSDHACTERQRDGRGSYKSMTLDWSNESSGRGGGV